MSDVLYDLDFPAWSERQAELLLRLSRGERVNTEIDWPHVIEEMRDLGRSDTKSVESLLTRALEHCLKIAGWANGPVDHWSVEAMTFLLDARRRWAPSMAQNIAVADLYDDAMQVVRRMRIDGAAPMPAPETCPLGIADLIVPKPGAPDIQALAALLRSE